MKARYVWPVLAAVVIAGCSPPSATDVVAATTFFRQSSAAHYHGTITTTDGRGCAKVTSKRFVCTAYVREPHEPGRNIDVYGIVTVHHGLLRVNANLAHGQEIQDWLMDTGGGCKIASCKGTVFRSG